MSTHEFLPWLSSATPSRAHDDSVDPDRRAFIKMLGMGGLVIAAGPMGIHRLNGAEAFFGARAESWSPAVYVSVADDGDRDDHLPPIGDGAGHPHHDANDHRR